MLTELRVRGREWATQAACAGKLGEFYAPQGTDYGRVRRCCLACPAQPDCLADAMAEERGAGRAGRFGFRGGFSPDERWRLAKTWTYNTKGK